jgi:hypothetical protein
MRGYRRPLAIALLSLSILAAPGIASAKGGGGGGGGGGTTPPAPTTAPCATLSGPLGDSVNIGRTITLKYNVTSCSSSAQTVSLVFTRTWQYQTDLGTIPIQCPVAGWTGPTSALVAGGKVSLSSEVPPRTCLVGFHAYTAITASLVGSSGRVLATWVSVYDIASKA